MSVNLTINGQPVTVPKGTRILEAAKQAKIDIPILCDHPDLCRRALCRICVVECDGSSKLTAACANDVWEGVNIVTNNSRILETRKTILELILADHPQDCLYCIRNKNCKLQSLAESFGIRKVSFDNVYSKIYDDTTQLDSAQLSKPSIESDTLVRDMDKCVKCSRCVEACQQVQLIGAINTSQRSHRFKIDTPYGQMLEETDCVFCGQCAIVCPVGAIYEHDQTAEVLAALNDSKITNKGDSKLAHKRVIAQVSPAFVTTFVNEFASGQSSAMNANAITSGKIIAAIKLLGFDKVYDASVTANLCASELNIELEKRINSGGKLQGKLPMISGCSDGVSRFVRRFFPDLSEHLAPETTRRIFAEKVKSAYAIGQDTSGVTTVSFMPCIAQKYVTDSNTQAGHAKNDFALTPCELTRMIKLAGIDICNLSEQEFDSIGLCTENQHKKEPLAVYGFAEARKVMEAIRKGECEAQWVKIFSCPDSSCTVPNPRKVL